ncbi:MAG: hypothetical protein LJF04_04430 [Gemmatimonadetes bacterium]|nr:hypothetical protein [Gemmatimonadota bacterium]
MTDEKGRSLTRHEFDAVIRRAAELASSDSETGESALTEAELFRIAREVGLSESHVRQALSEVRSGEVHGGALDRIFGPSHLRAMRVVPGTPKELGAKLDDFLAGTQLLQPVRRSTNVLQYRPALDWASQLARAASFTSRKYYVASAKSVEVHLEALDDNSTLVELLMDPGTRGDNVAGATFGGGIAGLAAGGGLAFAVLATGGAVALAIPLGLVGGGATTGGITYLVGKSHKKKLLEVQAELEGILDRLELGESLEPPPASWRRWVKRQFHGVAHELLSREQEEDLSDDRQ